MKVKDFIMKLDNAGIEISFFGSVLNDNELIAKGESESLRKTYNEYESGKFDTDKEVFSLLLKGLKQRVENYAEQKLFGNNPTGAIFALKNYGWKDKQEIESNISGNIEVTFSDPNLDEWAKQLDIYAVMQ